MTADRSPSVDERVCLLLKRATHRSDDDDEPAAAPAPPPNANACVRDSGRDAPEARQAQSEGEPPVGSDGVFFPHSWSRHPKKRQRKARRASGIDDGAEASRYQVEVGDRPSPRRPGSRRSVTLRLLRTAQHLSTLALERKAGLLTAEDGVRRLRLLDAKGKIWTQDVLLRVRRHDVSLLDADAECELEVFPLSAVQQCQAVTNACGFDSILALVCKDSGQRKADLHLFQCDHVKAHLIRADIQSALTDAKGGGPKKRPDVLKMIRNSRGEIPPPPAAPAPEPPTGPEDGESRADARSDRGGGRRTTTPPSSEDGTAAVVDRDVQILNRLLDDIEAFIGQLQKAAEACGQLARRKQNKKAAKKRTPGEGVLTLRSRAPGRRHFLDCLQKFKFVFNQLGKLNGRIRNPGADELLHFLFIPLRTVVQASGGADVARGVTVPPLTRDAVQLLRAAGTAEERRLWAALGDGWTKCGSPSPSRRGRAAVPLVRPDVDRVASRSEWPKDRYVPPVFADGWEPPAREAGREAGSPSTEEACPRPLAARPPVLEEDAESERAGGHQAKLNKRFAKSKYDFVARNNTELSVLKDELVEVLDDRKQWWKVRNGDGSLGYVPNNILDAAAPAVDVTGRGEAVYSHTIQLMMPRKEFEMFKQLLGELNEVTFDPGTCDSDPGPGAGRPLMGSFSPHQKQTGARAQTLSGKDVLSPAPPAGLPAPPPPPPPPPAIDAAADRDDGGAGTFATRGRSTTEEVRDELLQRLTLGRSAHKTPSASLRRGGAANIPGVSITYESSPDDVRGWLEAKGFSPVTVGSLGVLTGAQLFSLNKDELKTVCPDDGARVFSQVTVQKAALESGSELREVMRRRQEILAAGAGESGMES